MTEELYPGTEPAEPKNPSYQLEQEKKKATMVMLSDPAVIEALKRTLKVDSEMLKNLLLPQVGQVTEWGGLLWKVTYVRANPFRVSMEPIRVSKTWLDEQANKDHVDMLPTPGDTSAKKED